MYPGDENNGLCACGLRMDLTELALDRLVVALDEDRRIALPRVSLRLGGLSAIILSDPDCEIESMAVGEGVLEVSSSLD